MRFAGILELAPTVQSVCGAVAGSATASVLMLGDLAVAIAGVPLPVVLASAAGAGIARAMLPPTTFFSAVALSAAWTVVGCAGAPFAQAVAPAVIQFAFNREIVLPANTLAILGAAIASAPLWWPKVWPAIKAKFGKQPTTGSPDDKSP